MAKFLTVAGVAGLVVAAATLATAANAQKIAAGTGWQEAGVTLLDVDFPGTGFHARWEFFRCDCGDLLIRLEQTAPDGVLTGEMVLVDGQVILARGLVAQSADLEMMIQAPGLMLQLAFGLLQRAIPGGPADVPVDLDISVEEKKAGIEINTGTAAGHFGAPWSLDGRVWRAGPARRRFTLDFGFAGPSGEDLGQRGKISFSGGQDFGADGYPLADETPLDGWKLQWISKGETQPADPPEGQTLGELRAAAKALSMPPA